MKKRKKRKYWQILILSGSMVLNPKQICYQQNILQFLIKQHSCHIRQKLLHPPAECVCCSLSRSSPSLISFNTHSECVYFAGLLHVVCVCVWGDHTPTWPGGKLQLTTAHTTLAGTGDICSIRKTQYLFVYSTCHKLCYLKRYFLLLHARTSNWRPKGGKRLIFFSCFSPSRTRAEILVNARRWTQRANSRREAPRAKRERKKTSRGQRCCAGWWWLRGGKGRESGN